jgi:hypothetical protein
MSVLLDGNVIRLEGKCHVEDAEPLLALLQADRGRILDLSRSEALHSAVVQVMLAFKPRIAGESRDAFVRDWVMPCLAGAAAGR